MPQSLQNPLVLWLALSAALGGLVYAFLRRELRLKALLYGSFLLACGVAVWPPYAMDGRPGKIRLGLDLKGGSHFVLRVKTDDALVATVDDALQTARDQIARKGINVTSVERTGNSVFVVQGIEPARVKDVRDILRDFFRAGWEVRDRSESFEVAMTDPFVREIKQRTVRESIRTLERRVNELGVAEPVIAEHGQAGDQILVQLPGMTDVEQAKRMIQRTAQLHLKLVEDVGPSEEALLAPRGGKLPDNMEIYQGPGEQPGQPVTYLVRREAVITGRDLKHARAGIDPQTNSPDVQFTLSPVGADKFKRETGRNVGRQLAIILDGRVETAPRINSQIGADGVIQGRFTPQEADELAKVLRAGALPASLEFLQELSVGASLGRDSIRSGVAATVAGMSFLGVFMIFYYRLAGVNAIVALSANLLILLGALAYAGATLTLPGIAGIILTVGVGVDTNVLVFERIREELRNGKTVKAAIQNGFERVWITILDTHATALIAAAFLFQFGTGPIKGFAVTLVMGLIANVFASYFVSKFLFEWVLSGRQPAAQPTLSI
jgi:preprotein translocase subunit SecD